MRITTGGFTTDLKWWQVLIIPFSLPFLFKNIWIRKYRYRGKMLTLNQIAKIEHPNFRPKFRAAITWSEKRSAIQYVVMTGKLPFGAGSVEELLRG
jgi:hypothetical protein